ncbi:hypothetical protein GGX14DRAFT_665477 [Mycena pura]|uniref:Uncharacterized protein n=1 Tax=Mycena pura TaxID=153505 RepID=A0AAD6V3N2_9AGAR|nr:hypothetical protein GGX14DRAFT_665477 [Mycena pura]
MSPGGLASPILSQMFAMHTAEMCLRNTVNDPTSFLTPSRMHGSHHWSCKRLLSASLIPLTGAALTFVPNVPEGAFRASLRAQSHGGSASQSQFDECLWTTSIRKYRIALRTATVGVLTEDRFTELMYHIQSMC